MSMAGSIPRAARIMDVLSDAPDGLTLVEIVARSGYTKTTTFRVLTALKGTRFVAQDPISKNYMLGQKLVNMARIARRTDIASLAKPNCERLAELSKDTVFLSIPEGALAVCVLRTTGSFPVRTLTLDQGDVRPLGVGAGSLALFCAMDAERRRAVCRINQRWLKEYGTSKKELSAFCPDFEKYGYAMNRGQVITGTTAVSVPIVSADGTLIAAIAIGAIDTRMTDERVTDLLLPALKKEAALIAAIMINQEGD